MLHSTSPSTSQACMPVVAPFASSSIISRWEPNTEHPQNTHHTHNTHNTRDTCVFPPIHSNGVFGARVREPLLKPNISRVRERDIQSDRIGKVIFRFGSERLLSARVAANAMRFGNRLGPNIHFYPPCTTPASPCVYRTDVVHHHHQPRRKEEKPTTRARHFGGLYHGLRTQSSSCRWCVSVGVSIEHMDKRDSGVAICLRLYDCDKVITIMPERPIQAHRHQTSQKLTYSVVGTDTR